MGQLILIPTGMAAVAYVVWLWSGVELWFIFTHMLMFCGGMIFSGIFPFVSSNRTLGDDTAKRERMRNEQEQYLQMVRDLRADDRNSRM